MTITATLITATVPDCVAKAYSLVNGELRKKTIANVSKGKLEIVEFQNLQEFSEFVISLQTNQCLTYGVPPHNADLVSEREWQDLGCPSNPLPRTIEVFKWKPSFALLMLDYDAPKDGAKRLGKKDLVQLLLKACPGLATSDFMWFPSSSSHIYAGEKDLTGLWGQRIYIPVLDGTDIERAGKTLNERLWAMGHGHFEVSKSGGLLERGIFDANVWQSNRIDFAAGALCGEGLEQWRGEPFVFGGDEPRYLDTRTAVPELSKDEKNLVAENKKRWKSNLKAQADLKRREWIVARGIEIRAQKPELTDEQAEIVARRVVENCDLSSDWILTLQDRDNCLVNVLVSAVLADPDRYDGLLTLDPLEPDYDGSRLVGKLFLKGAVQNLFSFAHGGANYRLHRQPVKIELTSGKSSEATDKLLRVLRTAPDIFDFGSDLVRVGHHGTLYPLNDSSLRYFSGIYTQFYRQKILSDGTKTDLLLDPPDKICKSIVSLQTQRQLKKLNGVITAPTLKPNGDVLQAVGYDRDTQLLCDLPPDVVPVPAHPTKSEAKAALEALMFPFKDFPFCAPLDRAVLLAAILTAAVRPGLSVAPGFAFDAPAQGSGKTLLARSIGVLVHGSDPSVWPHVAGRDDEEIRKRIFSVLRSGMHALIWDNIVGAFDSPAVAACMTSPNFTDRILGQSASSTVPNRLMILFTGNNLLLQGEMPRRILVCRIDPVSERPFAREFSLDPFAYCRDNRQKLISSALTLIRAYLTHGCSTPISGRLASFEAWDEWVRRTVIYANELMPDSFADVLESITANQTVDSEQESLGDLLKAWHGLIGDRPVSVADLIREGQRNFNDPKHSALHNAINELPLNKSPIPNPKAIGKYLGFRKGRIVGGYRLEAGPKIDDRNTWRVCSRATGI